MKPLKLLMLSFGALMSLSSCDKTFEPIHDDYNVPSIEDIDITGGDEDIEPVIEHKTCKEISHGSSSGVLTEIGAGRYLERGYRYTASFKASTTVDGGLSSVRSDDRTIAYVEHTPGSTTFVIEAIRQGDAIIEAYDSNEALVLRFVVQVRNKISSSKIDNYLYNVFTFQGLIYGYQLTFIDSEPLTASMIGQDDFETTFLNFTCRNKTEKEFLGFNYYSFDMQIDLHTSSTQRTYTDFLVSVTGDEIIIYYTDGLIDMFRPNSI